MEPTMDDTKELLVAVVDQMVIEASKRYVETRLFVADIPPTVQRGARSELERQKGVIDHLVIFRKTLLRERLADFAVSAATNPPSHVRWRYESRPERASSPR
jgi:hypothetical protein